MSWKRIAITLTLFTLGLLISARVGDNVYSVSLLDLKLASFLLTLVSILLVLVTLNIVKDEYDYIYYRNNIDVMYTDTKTLIMSTIVVTPLPDTPIGRVVGAALLIMMTVLFIDIITRTVIIFLEMDTR